MKLKSKKTGVLGTPRVSYQELQVVDENGYTHNYESLQNMCEEWEDYEEPKNSEYYWYIGYKNDIRRTKYHHISDFADNQVTVTRKEIGNCFGSSEEAEKAVEKLKAYKRLKDKGFRFDGIEVFNEGLLEIDGVLFALEGADNAERSKIIDDLDLLFRGEE